MYENRSSGRSDGSDGGSGFFGDAFEPERNERGEMEMARDRDDVDAAYRRA